MQTENEQLDRLERLLESGEISQIREQLSSIVLNSPEEHIRAAELAEAIGDTSLAQTLYGSLNSHAPPKGPPPPQRGTEDGALLLSHRFRGREGVYARQWASRSKRGYSPVEMPFSAAVATRHLQGRETVGIYPVRNDHTVFFGALDVDLMVRDGVADRGARARGIDLLHRLIQSAEASGFPALIEDSGWKGWHLWFFFEQPMPAVVVRRALKQIAATAGDLPMGVSVEVFPKQNRVPKKGYGNLIKLPLGIHQVTKRRCALLTHDLQPHPHPLELLRAHPCVEESALRGQPQLHSVEATNVEPAEPEPEPFVLQDDAEWQSICLGCPVIRELARRAQVDRVLAREERHVLTYTVGNLDHGDMIVNSLFNACVDTNPTDQLRSPLRGHPMSCPKIRKRLPEIAASSGCGCNFQGTPHRYPHPLLWRDRGAPPPDALAEQWRRRTLAVREGLRAVREVEEQLLRALEDRGVETLLLGGLLIRRGRDSVEVVEGAVGSVRD